MRMMTDASNGLPDLARWPRAASSAEIARSVGFGLRRHSSRARATTSGRSSAMLYPSHLPVAAFLRWRIGGGLTTPPGQNSPREKAKAERPEEPPKKKGASLDLSEQLDLLGALDGPQAGWQPLDGPCLTRLHL
jgi:hypothetical protein